MMLWDMITSSTPFQRYKARELPIIYEVIIRNMFSKLVCI